MERVLLGGLEPSHLHDQTRATVQEFQNAVVNGVNLLAQIFDRLLSLQSGSTFRRGLRFERRELIL
jgi:hypothetical protein